MYASATYHDSLFQEKILIILISIYNLKKTSITCSWAFGFAGGTLAPISSSQDLKKAMSGLCRMSGLAWHACTNTRSSWSWAGGNPLIVYLWQYQQIFLTVLVTCSDNFWSAFCVFHAHFWEKPHSFKICALKKRNDFRQLKRSRSNFRVEKCKTEEN